VEEEVEDDENDRRAGEVGPKALVGVGNDDEWSSTVTRVEKPRAVVRLLLLLLLCEFLILLLLLMRL